MRSAPNAFVHHEQSGMREAVSEAVVVGRTVMSAIPPAFAEAGWPEPEPQPAISTAASAAQESLVRIFLSPGPLQSRAGRP